MLPDHVICRGPPHRGLAPAYAAFLRQWVSPDFGIDPDERTRGVSGSANGRWIFAFERLAHAAADFGGVDGAELGVPGFLCGGGGVEGPDRGIFDCRLPIAD